MERSKAGISFPGTLLTDYQYIGRRIADGSTLTRHVELMTLLFRQIMHDLWPSERLIRAGALRAEDRAEVCCKSGRQASDLNSIRGLCDIVDFADSFSSIF